MKAEQRIRNIVVETLRAQGVPASETAECVEVPTRRMLGVAHEVLRSAYLAGKLGPDVTQVGRRFREHFYISYYASDDEYGRFGVCRAKPPAPPEEERPPRPKELGPVGQPDWHRLEDLPEELAQQAARRGTIRAVPGFYVGCAIPEGMTVRQAIEYLRELYPPLAFWVHTVDGRSIIVSGERWMPSSEPFMMIKGKGFRFQAKTPPPPPQRSADREEGRE